MSNFLDDLFKMVFRASDKTPINHRENIVFDPREFVEAMGWLGSFEGEEILDLLYKNYQLKKVNVEERPQVHVLDSKYAQGFAITYDEPFTEKTFMMLFLAFTQRVLQLGYKQVSSDRKMVEVDEQVKVTERFFFKPPIQIPEKGVMLTQLYGNIAIEKVSVDNQPSFIKVLATYYSDRLYHDPKSFDHFLDHIFAVRKNG